MKSIIVKDIDVVIDKYNKCPVPLDVPEIKYYLESKLFLVFLLFFGDCFSFGHGFKLFPAVKHLKKLHRNGFDTVTMSALHGCLEIFLQVHGLALTFSTTSQRRKTHTLRLHTINAEKREM
jgi:hypothetical protein